MGQQIAGYRAPYVTPLFQDGAATPAQLDAIAKAAQLADEARGATARTVQAMLAVLNGLARMEGRKTLLLLSAPR